jgi:hypothetical protein
MLIHMKTKILLTLFVVAAYGWLITTISQTTEIIQKYASLKQFDNSELSFKLMQNIGIFTYSNYFLIVIAIFQLINIWKTKSCSNS